MKLNFVEPRIETAGGQQFVVRATFGDRSILDHQDLIAMLDRTEAVGDHRGPGASDTRAGGDCGERRDWCQSMS